MLTLEQEVAALRTRLAAVEAQLGVLRRLPDEIEQQVRVTREYAADSGMDKHQVELVAICTSHFLDHARQIRAALKGDATPNDAGAPGNEPRQKVPGVSCG